MILNFDKEVAAIRDVLGDLAVPDEKVMPLAMALFAILDRGMGMERERCIGIVQKMAISPMPIVAAIRKAPR